jgi:hypothetical protein
MASLFFSETRAGEVYDKEKSRVPLNSACVPLSNQLSAPNDLVKWPPLSLRSQLHQKKAKGIKQIIDGVVAR